MEAREDLGFGKVNGVKSAGVIVQQTVNEDRGFGTWSGTAGGRRDGIKWYVRTSAPGIFWHTAHSYATGNVYHTAVHEVSVCAVSGAWVRDGSYTCCNVAVASVMISNSFASRFRAWRRRRN